MNDKKTVLIVDDHPLFREGLVSLLSKEKGYDVVGDATSGEEGIAKAGKLHPDLVIMDISLPKMNGIEATRQIRKTAPETDVVILSIHSKIDFIIEAFRAGASGYLTKDATGHKLVECLETVLKGEYYVDTAVSRSVVKNILMAEGDSGKLKGAALGKLTQREQEIMYFIAEGLSTKQIAEKLYISQKTVENHRSSIFSKLEIHSTLELVRLAARYGIIDVDLWKK